uniref:Zinc finger protein 1 n=2 Tax=Cajanus cajan TaxID=3821 RepID=A0A151R3Z1_CAJCA|nr:Zinc finger protein 1 [Cajanus cajan]
MKRSHIGCSKAEAEPMTDEAIAVKIASPTMRECDICGKIFSSGKALGGHRRSHFQKHQKKVKVRFTNPSKAGDSSNTRANCDDDDDDTNDDKNICCICKKEFPTKNALFGHMRSHPERSWRGVSPPTHNKHSSSSSPSYSYSSHNSDSMEKTMKDHDYDDGDGNGDGDDCVGGGNTLIAPDEHDHTEAIDLSSFILSTWQKKDKRGRKCIGGIEAAETLVYLCTHARYFSADHESNRVNVAPKEDVLPKSAPPLTKHDKRKVDESSSSKKAEVKRIKLLLKVGNRSDGAGACGDDGGGKLNRCEGLSESGVERMVDDDVDEALDDVMNDAEVTPVTVTTRVQDHDERNNNKVKKVEKGKSGKKLVLKSKGKDHEYENVGSQEKVGGYKCGACGKVFSTFQGLGGHRSVHKEKNIVPIIDEPNQPDDAVVAEENNSSTSSNVHKMDEALLKEETIAADEAGQSSGTKTLDFDLNEPYVMED